MPRIGSSRPSHPHRASHRCGMALHRAQVNRVVGSIVGVTHSFQSEREEIDEQFAIDTIDRDFVCRKEHRMTLTFAADAEVPNTWDCRTCGSVAQICGEGGTERQLSHRDLLNARHEPAYEGSWVTQAHIDAVHARRTDAELEAMLAERLDVLRKGPSRIVA